MEFRLATLEDLALLIQLRKQLLIDEGQVVSSNIEDQLKAFFVNQFNSNQYVQWLVEQDNQVIATGAIQFIAFPPSYFNPTGIRGYIANMFTHVDFRSKGIAKKLLERLIAEAETRNVQHLFLIASEMGKPLYKKYGFNENDIYMECFVKHNL